MLACMQVLHASSISPSASFVMDVTLHARPLLPPFVQSSSRAPRRTEQSSSASAGEHGHLAKRAEPRADLGDEQLRLLPGRKVPALVELVVVDEVGIGLLCP